MWMTSPHVAAFLPFSTSVHHKLAAAIHHQKVVTMTCPPSRFTALRILLFAVGSLSVSFGDWVLVGAVAQPRWQRLDVVGRGGANVDGRQGEDAALVAAQATIQDYLDRHRNRSDEDVSRDFYIHGWRWHTMSLAREATRLQKLALRLQAQPQESDEDMSSLKKAASYVVDFNMKGLHKIERDLFFPWVRKRVAKDQASAASADMAKAFDVLMDRLDDDRSKIERLGASLVSATITASFFRMLDALRY